MAKKKILGRALPVIMTISQPDLNLITANGGSVGAVGSFSGNLNCPVNPNNNFRIMECRIDSQIQIIPAIPGDVCPYKIIIGEHVFGVGLHQ